MRGLKALFATAAIAAGLCLASQAGAAVIYDTPSTTPGDQGYSDVLGNDFTVNVSGLAVTELGAFDSSKLPAGITTDITVGLYNLTTSAWVTPLVNFNGTADPTGAAYVWQAITPVALTAGDQYSIVGLGFNGTDQNFNTNISGQNGASPIVFNSLGGELTNDLSRYGGGGNPSASTVFPYSSTFGAASLVVSAVPEPADWAMMLIGFGLLGAVLRAHARTDRELERLRSSSIA